MGDEANLYIAGEWRPTINGARRENRYPADCRLGASVAEASAEDTATGRLRRIWINDYHPYVAV